MLPTKPVKLEGLPDCSQVEIEILLDEVERLAAEQRAGFAPILAEASPLHFEALVLWTQVEAMWQRAQQARLNAVIESMLARPI